MQMSNNTILITGGGSGIGQALAEMFHAKGNTVLISGRDKAKLDAVARQHDGMVAMTLDITDSSAITDFAARIQTEQIGCDDLPIAEAGGHYDETYQKINHMIAGRSALTTTDSRTVED